MKQKLLVIGSSNIDLIMRLPTFPKPGETLQSLDYQQAYGGKGANQALAAAKLGGEQVQTQFMTCVGDDASGESLLQSLHADNVGINGAERIADTATGTAMIWLTAAGENSIAIAAAANACLTADYIGKHQQMLLDSDMLLLQLETPLDGVEYAVNFAKQHGKIVMLNPAPAQALSQGLLSQVDIITPNETEAEILTGITVIDEQSAKSAADVLHGMGIAQVLITRGADGVFFSDGETRQNYPSFAVEVVDTTAAGDTFNGAFAVARLQGNDMATAIRFAQAAAALSVQKLGAQPSIPYLSAVQGFLLL